ncbi:MAG: Mur ligase domain-containing protein, partial [Thiohalophilus sp.]
MMTAPKTQSLMTLATLLDGIVSVPDALDCVLEDMTSDSRQVTEGYLFVAVRGQQHDGADYIDAAIEQGAVAVLQEIHSQDSSVEPVSWKTSATGKKIPLIGVISLS